ncbi:SIMPL domain-containing protein [Sphingobacterium rhinopitheci]|uniref:SIMPL domain-containing protein n=1 Tax=Sphingobacterium rhinopitheci TaxID=2781960 RepID=UPI001F528EE2|nr:SIMPL domain-containing protein [Sphingobacterium rhinopitheci]MCI0921851.1 SIMPL domain-containing protein [Sphingobacterium rhinopitheci]
MKKISTLLVLIISIITVNAQTINVENSRKVATKGYAEKEVTPDIIYLSINIKEFYKDGNQKKKVSIETLEKQLFDAAIAAGVKKEDFTIQNIFSYNQQNKKKNNELLQSRQYRIKVTNLNGLNDMMDKIDPQGLQSTAIEGYDHSKKREIEKELKTTAVKDARNNAEILAAADGQSIGNVLVINDNSNFNFNDLIPQPRYMLSKVAMADNTVMESNALNLDIKPIKLSCYIDCVFALK